ncbi:hypothetical protein K488DRAFT_13258, partial [Vararia minispora EC-137]
DGRWVALGSRKRTVHVFATNPYGGPPDERSHMAGRVLNAPTMPAPTTVSPITRIRAPQPQPGAPAPASLAVTFVASSPNALPKRLLPPAGSRSPVSRRRPTNFQDILMFDPLDGTLSLRRFFVEQRQSEHSLSVPSGVPGIGGTSISLPTRPSFGLPSSPPSARRPSALSVMIERPVELYARESEIATWNLRRGRDWEAVRGSIGEASPGKFVLEAAAKGKPNWLWQAELQTSSPSRRILPRSIYLVHQFSFSALGEDYQGLVRRHRLDVVGTRIAVRREVAVSAHASAAGDAPFAQHAGPASFDEGLSSAMSSSLEVGADSPPVIPMYPNGGASGSYKAAIPIGRVAEG